MADEKEWYGSAVEEGDAGAAPSIPPGYPDSISDQIAAQLASNVRTCYACRVHSTRVPA